MNRDEAKVLMDRIERAPAMDLDLSMAALRALGAAIGSAHEVGPSVADVTDHALALVKSVLPGWSVTLEGAALEHGARWTCTLRRSGTRDDEEVIGVGRAASPPLSIVAALLKVQLIRSRGYD